MKEPGISRCRHSSSSSSSTACKAVPYRRGVQHQPSCGQHLATVPVLWLGSPCLTGHHTAGDPGEVAAHHGRKRGRQDLHPASCGRPVVIRLRVHPQVCPFRTYPRPPFHAPVYDAAAPLLDHRAPAWILQGCRQGGRGAEHVSPSCRCTAGPSLTRGRDGVS